MLTVGGVVGCSAMVKMMLDDGVLKVAASVPLVAENVTV